MSFTVQARRDALVKRRVELRRMIERQTQLLQWRSGDAIDGRLRLENLQLQLRNTEPEYRELEAMLGRPHPVKPIKLDAPARTRSVHLRAPTRSASGYITKVMLPD